MGTISIRIPTAPPSASTSETRAQHEFAVRGSRVGLRFEGGWHSWNFIVRDWERRLTADGANVAMLQAPNGRAGADGQKVELEVREWAESVDFAVLGLGTCGSCTAGTVKDATLVESLGKPAVAAVCEEFAPFARTMATTLGHPALPLLVLPYPLETRSAEFWREVSAESYPRFLELVGAAL